MQDFNTIKKVISKISSVEEIKDHICFFGGSMPYIYYNKESGREHSDIDILVDKEYLDTIRDLLKEHNLYHENLDSVNLDLGMDYGLKACIDGVYVEFEPMSIENGIYKRSSFSIDGKKVGTEEIPYTNIEDLIIPINIDGNTTYCESMELTKARKEMYGREKDLRDAEFISKQEFDNDKYVRAKKALESSKSFVVSYDEIRKHNDLKEMLDDSNENINNEDKNKTI